MVTISHWLDQTAAQLEQAELFFGHGTDSAWDEAVQLVLFIMKLPADSGQSVLGQTVSDIQGEQITALLRERIDSRRPLPYLTQQAWFMGLPFYVDERVLIPRSPFAEWIQQQFTPWVKPERVQRILEIGTGSGCMAIAAALQFPGVTVDAIDISEPALLVAAKNVAQYDLGEQVQLIESDGFDALQPTQQYDIIMTNPPYVSAAEMAELPAEFKHEPRLALEAEADGLAIIERILQQAAPFLSDHGILVGEVGHSDATLQARYPTVAFTWLEQAEGGQGLFVLSKQECQTYFGT